MDRNKLYITQTPQGFRFKDIYNLNLKFFDKNISDDSSLYIDNQKKIQPIPGNIPSMNDLPSGCYFHPRCGLATNECKIKKPELIEISNNRKSRCFEYKKLL